MGREIAYFLHVYPVNRERIEKLQKQQDIDVDDIGKFAAKGKIFSGWYVVYKDRSAEKKKSREAIYKNMMRYAIISTEICFNEKETIHSLNQATRLKVLSIEDSPNIHENPCILQNFGLGTLFRDKSFFRTKYHVEGIASFLNEN